MAMSWIRSVVRRALIAPKPRGSRQFTVTAAGGGATQTERVAAEMVRYALGGAVHRSSPEEAMRILEQGASNLQGGGEGSAEAVGLLMLAMSTLLYRSGRRQDAVEKLKATQQVAPSAVFRVAAWEALMGLHMEAGQEMSYLISPNDSVDLSIKYDSKWSDQDHLKFRVNAVRGLVTLLNGETESAAQLFDGWCRDFSRGENQTENAAVSYGEYLHCVGDFQMAAQVYEKILEAFCMDDMSGNLLAAGNMVPEEASLGATCSYGQLLSHSGKFAEAEDYLTRALQKAEEQFGANHPKVGIILTCVARMYKLKAKSEGSTSIMVQEGLYRKALEVLKAPAINSEGKNNDLLSMISSYKANYLLLVATGEYAELLLIQSNRKAEGERMKQWAEDAWRNRRLTLAQALEFSEPSKPTVVVDTRIGRVV
ncbi:Tetratricopeptide repeat (TPR)-like superfamily protein [Zea mays]|uniref:Tetratricopeptide repeat (TPR)-like superfamily protein n=1 Tax=Zea mays TaxID=4577 RepID=A0A1D6FRJ9_MAIZE|nr:Tetratricopeptide repeat (TPR)-like superfamily protein [Zea mays]